jgi:hypothetical protein
MKKITAALALAASLLASGSVSAAQEQIVWTALPDTSSAAPNYTYDLTGTSLGGSFQVSGNPTSIWYDFEPPVWSGSNELNAAFDALQPGNNVTFGDPSNSFSGNTINLAGLANYVAVHFGGGSLLFYFQNAVSSLTLDTSGITGAGAGLSAWSSDQSAVPLPGAVWLLGTALLGFVGLSRRKAISGD